MKFKKFILITMMFLVMLSVGAVSAVDDVNSTDNVFVDGTNDISCDLQNEYDDVEQVSNDYVIVNSSNYLDYFHGNGTLRYNDDLCFMGNFSNLRFSSFVIDKSIGLDFNNANFNNIGFTLKANDLTLKNAVFNYDVSGGSVISLEGTSNVIIDNVTIDYKTSSDSNSYAVDLINSNNVQLLNNNIRYFTNVTNTNVYNYVIKVVGGSNNLVRGNKINAFLPLKDCDFSIPFPNTDIDLVAGVAVQSSNGFKFLNNELNVSVSARDSNLFYPTLDSFLMVESNNSVVAGNNIIELDSTTETGSANYLYGIDIYKLNNISIWNNTVKMNTNGGSIIVNGSGSAYPVQITGPINDCNIYNNTLITYNNGPNLGIYSQNFYGATYLNIYNNFINVTGSAALHNWALVSGMELQDTCDIVHDNIIYVTNNGAYADSNNIYGISYSQSTSSSHSFDVYNNTIFTNGNYAVYLNGVSNTNVTNNGLSTYIKTGNDAVYIAGSNNNINGNYNPNPTSNSDVLNLPILKANFRNEIISESENSEKIVYVAVNKNITADGGNGSIENPFNTLKAVSNYIKNNPHRNYIICFMGGYYIIQNDDYLYAGAKGNVTIKPYNNEKVIIFNNNEGPSYFIDMVDVNTLNISDIYFEKFGVGFISFGRYGTSYVDNCTFKDRNWASSMFVVVNKLIVTNCNFINISGSMFVETMKASKYFNENVTMNYCNFINISSKWFKPKNNNFLNLNNCWFGYNNVNINNANVIVSNNALFSISENQIAPGLFEITGKLMWNDTTMDGIDKLGLKTVYLSSPSGNFSDNNPVLKNGTFTVIYKSDLTAHNITAVLDNEVQNLLFNEINMSVETSDIVCGENATVSVILPANVTGNVTVNVNNKNYTKNNVNGTVIFIISDLAVGTYNVAVSFVGDEAQGMATAVFEVYQLTPVLNITVNDIIEGENATVVITLPEDATGSVNVTAGDKSQIVTVVNGTAKAIFTSLPAGKYNITAIYSGDNKYTPANETAKFTVDINKNVNLNISDIVMIYKDGTRMVAVLTDYKGNPIANATVYFTINGVTYAKITDANGTASMGLNLLSNIYEATVSYNGSDMYDGVSKNITVTINPTILSEDISLMYMDGTSFVAKFLDKSGKALVNTKITFNINGVFYDKVTDADGMAKLGIRLRPDVYILTAYNPVTGEEKGFNINVKSLIESHDLTKYYLNESRYEVTLYNKDGSLAVNKTVTFNINGVFYTKTSDANGVASLGISLRPGEYIITTIFDGLSMGNKVTVLPTLVTHDLTMKYMDGSRFTVQTLDGQGKALSNQNVSFNVNGVFYYRTTDSNGMADLLIRLMPGEYIITSYCNDFQTGNTIKIA
ncbi:MAG: Ig-like domain repeat protein [Methanobrevibacter smithii]